MPWFGQGVDAADGDFYLARRWYAPWQRYLELDWDATESERAVNGLVNMHKELSKATGGEAVVPFTWTVLRMLVTPHPLGGCAMAASPAWSITPAACSVIPGSTCSTARSCRARSASIRRRRLPRWPNAAWN